MVWVKNDYESQLTWFCGLNTKLYFVVTSKLLTTLCSTLQRTTIVCLKDSGLEHFLGKCGEIVGVGTLNIAIK